MSKDITFSFPDDLDTSWLPNPVVLPRHLARATLALLEEPFAETPMLDSAIVAETLLESERKPAD